MNRRTFLTASGGLVASALAIDTDAAPAPIPKRPLGKTGQNLSIIGFGGIVVNGHDQAEADRLVREAFDRGVNYFDVAPSYGNGEAEEKLGAALTGLRDRVFLACKTQKRDAAGARAELEQSLKRLRTDHFELYQLHALTRPEDLEQAAGPGGALESFLKAREQGLIRWIGFSAHSAEVALAAMDRFPFDTILFPVNFVTWKAGFGPQVIAKAMDKGMGRLALKAMALRRWERGETRAYPKCWYRPVDDPSQASLAVRWTLSQPITAAVPPGDARLFRQALDIAARFRPITEPERQTLARLAEGIPPLFELAKS
ncbi:MAG: aldo/keto reductase [Armatimonadota bacterium]|nr:aldo/keto reductase [Armatimonadota bacterium]